MFAHLPNRDMRTGGGQVSAYPKEYNLKLFLVLHNQWASKITLVSRVQF